MHTLHRSFPLLKTHNAEQQITESLRGVPHSSADWVWPPEEMALTYKSGYFTSLRFSNHHQPRTRNVGRSTLSTLWEGCSDPKISPSGKHHPHRPQQGRRYDQGLLDQKKTSIPIADGSALGIWILKVRCENVWLKHLLGRAEHPPQGPE